MLVGSSKLHSHLVKDISNQNFNLNLLMFHSMASELCDCTEVVLIGYYDERIRAPSQEIKVLQW